MTKRIILFLLKFVFWAFVVSIPLFGVWTASSMAAYRNGPVWAVVLAGSLLFPLGPIAWELVGAWRNHRRGIKRLARKGTRFSADKRVLTRSDRLLIRTFVLNASFMAVMLYFWPTTVFTSLSGRGDWMLDGRDGETATQVRQVLFGAADGLEWLFESADEQPYEGLAEGGEAPPPAPSENERPDSRQTWKLQRPAGTDDTPEQVPDDADTGGDPGEEPQEPEQPTASESGDDPPPKEAKQPEGYAWPSDSKLHPLVVDLPASALMSVDALGMYIRDHEPEQRGRIKAIHDWVAHNIAYDTAGLADGSYHGRQGSDQVFQSRIGVCAGYSNLMVALADAMGEEVVYVRGHSREQDGSIAGSGHAWNAAKVDGRWELIDATWDAGFVNGPSFTRQYETGYLFTPPEIFILTHLPNEPGWQLLEQPLSRGEFTRSPMMRPDFFSHGFSFMQPLRSQVTVEDQLQLLVNNPKRHKMSVTYAPRSGGVIRHCDVTGERRLLIECDFPSAGDYELTMFGAKPGEMTLWSVGRLEVNSTG
jgi:hypothetical protein